MLVAAALTFALGPRNTREAEAPPLAVPTLPEDTAALPAFIAGLEARHGDIVPGTEKLVRLGPAGAKKAPWAVVYLHGFSATRQEISPLPEQVADALGAHLFATRLAGHGRGSAAMAEGSVAAWKADALEALAVGRRLGERVLVIGTSTGAALAAWLAQQPEAREGTAWVLVSPNFGVTHPFAEVINWPWGRTLARWVTGPEHRFEPRNDEHARYWTTRYPSEALFALMATVHLARTQPLEQWRAPVLMLLSPRDQVIDAGAARAAFARIGSPVKRLVEVVDADDTMQHVIAGRILSPSTTDRTVRTIAEWVAALPPAA
ncbi:MAG: alpha/beta fold hydrolase [Rubrivivax sp.]|nr:alpha/beta fold hydrolase [Rubrivivax sp.]